MKLMACLHSPKPGLVESAIWWGCLSLTPMTDTKKQQSGLDQHWGDTGSRFGGLDWALVGQCWG